MKTHARTIAINGDAILLMHRWRDEREYFVIPGGSVEEGERIEDAALRGTLDRIFFEDHDGNGDRHVVFLVHDVTGEPTLENAVSELSYTSAHNRFRPEWVPLREVACIALFPEALKARIVRDLVPSDSNG